MNKIEKKLNLLLRCWLSDKDDLSYRAVEVEKQLLREVMEEIGEITK
jgi:hypothetical protein